MWLLISLFLGVALLVLFRHVWTVVLLIPFCVLIGVFYLVVRSNRRRAAWAASVERDVQFERRLNEQEFNAWHASAEDARRKASRRETVLRRFDKRDRP